MSALTDRDGPVITEPIPRRVARGMIGAGVSLLIVGLLVAWIWLGRNPSMVPGDVSAVPGGPMRVDTDGIQPTRWVLDGNAGGEGTVRLSIRNDGSAAITVLGLGGADSASAADIGWWGTATFGALSPRSEISYERLTSPSVRLSPGEQTLVAVTVHAPQCLTHAAGSALEATTLPLRVRSLGLTTEQDVDLPLALTITFPLGHAPAPNCA